MNENSKFRSYNEMCKVLRRDYIHFQSERDSPRVCVLLSVYSPFRYNVFLPCTWWDDIFFPLRNLKIIEFTKPTTFFILLVCSPSLPPLFPQKKLAATALKYASPFFNMEYILWPSIGILLIVTSVCNNLSLIDICILRMDLLSAGECRWDETGEEGEITTLTLEFCRSM